MKEGKCSRTRSSGWQYPTMTHMMSFGRSAVAKPITDASRSPPADLPSTFGPHVDPDDCRRSQCHGAALAPAPAESLPSAPHVLTSDAVALAVVLAVTLAV